MLYLLQEPAWVPEGQAPRSLPPTVPAALVVVLASRGGWVPREQLALVFWPDAAPDDGLHHLRINLHRAKRLLAGWGCAEALQSERTRLRLDLLPCDLARLRDAIADGDGIALAQLNPSAWLLDWHLPGYDGFRQWSDDTGRALQARWLAASLRCQTVDQPARVAAVAHSATGVPPGRRTEMQCMWDSGAPALLLVGEPGAGKTTLLLAAHPNAPVLRGLEGLHTMPYQPLLAALREHLSALLRALADPAGALRPYRLDLARLLPELAPEEALPALDALTARSRLIEALTRAFEALTPVLLVDDLQWCDSATVDWLLLLAHSGRLRWRAAVRRHEIGPELQRQLDGLHSAQRLQTLQVNGLDREAVAEVCRQHDQGLADQPGFIDRLHALSGGNAFLLVELLNAGLAASDDIPSASTQARIAQLVVNRLAGLPEALRAAVEVAAVFVQPVPAGALQESATGACGAAWAEACQRAVAAGLLRATEPDGALVCRHDLVRQTIQLSLAPARALALHRHAARWLAARADDGHAIDALTIAEHWRAAGDAQTALAWSHRGAEQLKARGNFALARGLWREVADEAQDAAQRLRAQLELAACDLFEDLARGEAALEAVHASLGAVADPDSRRQLEGRVRAALVDNRVFAGDIARAQLHAEHLRALLPALSRAEQADALEVLIELAMREPDIPAAWALLAQLRQLAPRRPSLLGWEGQIHWFGGQPQAAHDALARLLERHPEYCGGMTIENDLAVMLHALGRIEEAEVMVRRSLQSWAGVAHAEAISLMVLGVVLLSAARFEEADQALQRAVQLARDQASPGFEAEGLVRRARVMLQWQRPLQAQQALEEAAPMLADSPEPLRVSQYVLARVLAALALHRPWPAADVARLVALAQRSQHPLVQLRLARVNFEQALSVQNRPVAAKAAAQMVALARRHQMREALAEALLLQSQATPDEPAAQRWRSEATGLVQHLGLQALKQRFAVGLAVDHTG
jgi:tetratricopeptide (TPR) repeat protein